MSYSKLLVFTLAVASASALSTGSAHAQRTAFGIRGGVTDDPDTGFFGIHGAIHLRGAPRLRLEPSFEFGVGDPIDFSLRFNFRFKYMVPLGRNAAVYPLFGPSVYHVEVDPGDNTEFGIDLGGGFAVAGFFFDLALGLPDDNLPDFTFTLGYTFW